MATDQNWSKAFSGISQRPKEWLDDAERQYGPYLQKVILTILLSLVLGVGLNAAGWKEINFLFALVFILWGVVFALNPKFVLTMFGVGVIWDGFLDRQVSGGKASLDQGVKFVRDKYVRPVSHALLLGTVVFICLGTFRIHNPAAMLPLIVVVIGLGLWAALFASDTTWYKRVTLKILLVSGVVALIGAYIYTPTQTERVAEEIQAKSETNLDVKNERKIRALKEYVDAGGVLTSEQQATLDQAVSEVSGKARPIKKAENWFSEYAGKVQSLNKESVQGWLWIPGVILGGWVLIRLFKPKSPRSIDHSWGQKSFSEWFTTINDGLILWAFILIPTVIVLDVLGFFNDIAKMPIKMSHVATCTTQDEAWNIRIDSAGKRLVICPEEGSLILFPERGYSKLKFDFATDFREKHTDLLGGRNLEDFVRVYAPKTYPGSLAESWKVIPVRSQPSEHFYSAWEKSGLKDIVLTVRAE